MGVVARIEMFFFRLLLARLSKGEQPRFFHYRSSLGELYFFRKNGWPGKTGGTGFSRTAAGNTIFNLIIEGQPDADNDWLASKLDREFPNDTLPPEEADVVIKLPPKRDAIKTAFPLPICTSKDDDEVVFEPIDSRS